MSEAPRIVKHSTVDGVGYTVTLYRMHPPAEWDWEARTAAPPHVLVARCCCWTPGHAHPVQAARSAIRRLPRRCRDCREKQREPYCELWRLGPGNWQKLTADERREYEEATVGHE